ncbi:hypothetical protein ACFQ1M_13015 [Sungkyunkwania multivorans]|uniref:Uncharacterized protein n=1 Tax=Sungkyunkwania multivorans TaxID=1173618 RepID=A0ABW3CZ76_9FLAO
MNKLSRDLFFSTGFSVLNVLFNFWLIQQAEYLLSAVALGVFMLMRRVVPTFTNLSQLGTSQAIIRYASIYKNEKQKIKTYFFLSFSGWIVSTIVLGLIYLALGQQLGDLTYDGTANSKQYFLYTVWYISIIHLSYLVQPYFLTLRKVLAYNFINLLNASLILIVVFKYLSSSVTLELLLSYSLTAMSVLQLVLLLYIVLRLEIYRFPSVEMIKTYGKEFYAYGIPRSIITFSDMFLLTIGSLLVGSEQKQIASFLIALALTRIVLIILQPVSKLSSVIVGNNNSPERQKAAVNLMSGTILYATTLLVIILYNWLDVLLEYWLSKPETIKDVLYAFKIMAIGLVPYSIFHGLKGIIEIKFFKPYNLYTLIAAIVSHVALFYILEQFYDTLYALSFSLMIAFVILGIATAFWCRKDFLGNRYYRFDMLLIVGGGLFALNYYVNGTFQNIYACLICVLVSTTIYLFILYITKAGFVFDTLETLLKKKN